MANTVENTYLEILKELLTDDQQFAQWAVHDKITDHFDSEAGITPGSDKHVHVVVVGSGSKFINIVRHVAFIAHYTNYVEKTGANKSRITYIDTEVTTAESLEAAKEAVREATGNLLDHTTWRSAMAGEFPDWNHEKKDELYTDLEIEIIGITKDDDINKVIANYCSENAYLSVIHDSDVPVKNDLKIDAQGATLIKVTPINLAKATQEKSQNNSFIERCKRAAMANGVYTVGSGLRHIKPSEMFKPKQYQNLFKKWSKSYSQDFKKLEREMMDKYKDGNVEYAKSLILSNLICSHNFGSRMRAAATLAKAEQEKREKQTQKRWTFGGLKIKLNFKRIDNYTEADAISDNLQYFADTEHQRWIVEKLILGFRPLNAEEKYEDVRLSPGKKSAYRKALKKRKIHINLCTCANLMRIDPENFKYDCFLSLALVEILKKTAGSERKVLNALT